MKRLSFLTVFLMAGASAFAAGAGSSDLEDFMSVLGLIMFLWGILEIILFFKIWGMTNDIRALKKEHFNERETVSNTSLARYVRRNIVLGNTDEVKNIFLQNFIDNVEEEYSNMQTSGYILNEKGEKEWVDYEEDNLNKSLKHHVDNLIMLFAKIGEEVPAYILKMKTFRDYYKMFVKEDFEVNIPEE